MSLEELLETRTPEGAAFTRLQLALFQLHGRLAEALDELARPDDLTLARCQVLASIDIAGRPLNVAAIARHMGLTRQSVQRSVNVMAAAGLLALEVNPDHKRSALVRMTDAGEIKAGSVRGRHQAWADEVGSRFDLQQLVTATVLLNELASILGTDPNPTPEEDPG